MPRMGPKRAARETTIGKNIKLFREEVELSQADAAGMAGIGVDALRKIEAGRTKEPSLGVMQRLATLFGRPIEHFSMDRPPPSTQTGQPNIFMLKVRPGITVGAYVPVSPHENRSLSHHDVTPVTDCCHPAVQRLHAKGKTGMTKSVAVPALLSMMGVAWDTRLKARVMRPPYSTQAIVGTVFPDVLVTGEYLPRGVHEVVNADKDKGRTIFYSRRLTNGARRIAIMHGCAHFMWDIAEGCSPARGKGAHRAFREQRADLYAGEVLVPLEELHARMGPHPLFPDDPVERRAFRDDVDRCSSTFNVTRTFLLWRLRHLVAFRKHVRL